MHHAVNLMRYSVTGYADSNPTTSLIVMVVVALVVFFPMQWITTRNLKAN